MHRSPLTWFLLVPTFLSVVFFTSCERGNPQGEQVKVALDGGETSGDAEPIVADPVDIPPPPEPVMLIISVIAEIASDGDIELSIYRLEPFMHPPSSPAVAAT